MFLVTLIYPRASLTVWACPPSMVVEEHWFWQPVTYMFLHAAPTHILFNMLILWMFGVELERMWKTRLFVRIYAITGVGAGLLSVPGRAAAVRVDGATYNAHTIGASGALYGLLLAFALTSRSPDPDVPVLPDAGEVLRR